MILRALRWFVPRLLALVLAGCGGVSATTAPASGAGNVPVMSIGKRPPEAMVAEIDARLRSEWQKRAVTPSAPADDARFLRRVFIDVAGTLPLPERATAFIADPSPDKRTKLVAELLASKQYADHSTAIWDDLLMPSARAGALDRVAFRVWLHEQFERNVPWNEVVYSLLTASGRQTAGHQRTMLEARAALAAAPDVNAATNYALRFRGAPQDFAGSAAKTFLGTQIQCAQCHDHKTEQWTQDEFRRFAASFTRVAYERRGRDPNSKRLIDVHDVERPLSNFSSNPDVAPIASAQPTALDGKPLGGNVRQSAAKWMIDSESFSRAIVNRMWGHFLGRGFVNPVDDLRPSNPAELPDLLERLARDFRENGHDLKRLITIITSTEVYALSSVPRAKTVPVASDIPLWSQFRMTPMRPNELVSSVIAATGTEAAFAKRAGGGAEIDDLKIKLTKLFSFVFDVDEEFDQERYEGTLAQALELMNGKLTSYGSSARPGTAVHELARGSATDDALVEALFLRTLSRRPTAEESATFVEHLRNRSSGESDEAVAPSPSRPRKTGKGMADPLRKLPSAPAGANARASALEDIQWALLNSSEFALNH